MTTTPILQFGTSRFLQAHVDLFVSQALARGEALGAITVVQTTASAESAARVAAFNAGGGYDVRVRGLREGREIDTTVRCHAIVRALHADTEGPLLLKLIEGEVQAIVSNTGDRGYLPGRRGFPARLLALLHHRWQANPAAPLSIYPCELVSRNGDTLREIVATLALESQLPGAFIDYLRGHCVWVNSLVDRIVSEPLQPAGAVAEPYALWAIERQHGLVLPCRHEAIALTDELDSYERRKLWLLNLGHSWLAECWLQDGSRAADETVLQAMQAPARRASLEDVWAEEVLPVFDALGQGAEARAYLAEVRERLLNPFLAHRLADIANDHAAKKQRRFVPVIAMAESLGLRLPQSRLRARC